MVGLAYHIHFFGFLPGRELLGDIGSLEEEKTYDEPIR
jgi:hypothetical protein